MLEVGESKVCFLKNWKRKRSRWWKEWDRDLEEERYLLFVSFPGDIKRLKQTILQQFPELKSLTYRIGIQPSSLIDSSLSDDVPLQNAHPYFAQVFSRADMYSIPCHIMPEIPQSSFTTKKIGLERVQNSWEIDEIRILMISIWLTTLLTFYEGVGTSRVSYLLEEYKKAVVKQVEDSRIKRVVAISDMNSYRVRTRSELEEGRETLTSR